MAQRSIDGMSFTDVLAADSSGKSTAIESYAITPITARYVRVVVNGNTHNEWASITDYTPVTLLVRPCVANAKL